MWCNYIQIKTLIIIHLIKQCKLIGGNFWKTGCKLCLLYFVSVVISKASWERVRPAMTSVWPVTAQARSVFRVEKVSIWPTGSAGRTAPPWVTWEKTARANVVLLIAISVPVLTRVQVSDSYYCVTNKKSATSCLRLYLNVFWACTVVVLWYNLHRVPLCRNMKIIY